MHVMNTSMRTQLFLSQIRLCCVQVGQMRKSDRRVCMHSTRTNGREARSLMGLQDGATIDRRRVLSRKDGLAALGWLIHSRRRVVVRLTSPVPTIGVLRS